MGIYLPIAELSVNVFVLLAMGAAVGFLSGMFGVGGGFLITPLLIFYNIPPAIAVATGANQVIASSFSGALAHFKRGTLDFKLGTVLLGGGIIGSTVENSAYEQDPMSYEPYRKWAEARGVVPPDLAVDGPR